MCLRRLGLACSLPTAPIQANLCLAEGRNSSPAKSPNKTVRSGSPRDERWCAAWHLSCFPTKPALQTITERFSFAVAPEFSMHTHPSFEVPRCPHCGLIQFRRVVDKCVRCKKPLDDLATFASSLPKHESKETLAQRVGVAVRTLRKKRKFTQQRLATLMGTGRSYISKLESGRVAPSLHTLQRATSALSIDLAELFLRVRRQT